MGLINGKPTDTVDAATIEQYVHEMDALRSRLREKSQENDFLRRRVGDLTQYASLLEEDLRKEKQKSSEKDQDIERYSIALHKLDENYRLREGEKMSLIEQNNRLSFELSNREKEREKFETQTEQKQQEEKYGNATKPILPLPALYFQLENLKSNVDSAKNDLLKEINSQKSSVKDAALNALIQEHDRYNQILKERGVFVGDRNLVDMEQSYRVLCLKNNETKIGIMRQLYEIENDLKVFSERLGFVEREVLENISPLLNKHQNKFESELRGASFAEDYQNEQRIYEDLTTRLQNEIMQFKRLLANPANEAPMPKVDNSNDSSKGWSFDVFDQKS